MSLMSGKIRIKAVEKAGTVTVKALIKHPMETGRRKDQNGNLVPSHHITIIRLIVNGNEVMEGQWGTGIAKNPYMSIQYYGKKGDIVSLKLLDNTNKDFFVETVVK